MRSSKPSPDRRVVLAVVGPTAAGKSAVAVALAERFGGEIVSCDSMQVYRGFDIGTDKPGPEERRRAPHHLLDIVDSSTQFTAADFAGRAALAIAGITERGHLPIVAGGTGLYLKALFEGLFPDSGRDPAVRARLEEEARGEGLASLRRRLAEVDPAYAAKTGERDRVRIIRALEVYAVTGVPLSSHFPDTAGYLPGYRAVKIGLLPERPELYRRIEKRVDEMFARGLVDEVRGLLGAGVEETSPPFRALGYGPVLRHLRGEITLAEATALTKMETRRYAKRQITWFRKMPEITWFGVADIATIAVFVAGQLD
jgi:tRNA dimethylallyltransferase